MNRSATPLEAEVVVELAALHRGGDPRATTLPDKLVLQTERKDTRLVLRLKLEGEQATAIRIRP